MSSSSSVFLVSAIETTLTIIGTLVIIAVIYSIIMKDSVNKLFNKLKENITNSSQGESVIASLAFSKLAIDDNAITTGRSLVPVTGAYAGTLENFDSTVLKSKENDTKLYPLF